MREGQLRRDPLVRFAVLPALAWELTIAGPFALQWREGAGLILIGAVFFVLADVIWPADIMLNELALKVYEAFVLAPALLSAAVMLLGLGRLTGIDLMENLVAFLYAPE